MNSNRLQLTRYNMSPRVTAFSTTRHGGVSEGSYASFNINDYCGDTPEHVAANRCLLADEIGISPDCIIMPHQTHGVETRTIDSEFLSLPASARQMRLEGIDALMTDVHGLCIGVSTADCIPLLLYDDEHHAACAIHAGWRGTLARIAKKAVNDMRLAYSTDPKRLKAVIGPGISLDNFEVGDEVYTAFEEAGFDMAAIADKRTKQCRDAADAAITAEKKWHINLPLANRLQLEHAGLTGSNIHDTGICTYDKADIFFSARRLGVKSGRIFTGIKLL